MSPAGGGAQELGVPLGAVAGRVGGSLQAVGLDGGCSPWGLALGTAGGAPCLGLRG